MSTSPATGCGDADAMAAFDWAMGRLTAQIQQLDQGKSCRVANQKLSRENHSPYIDLLKGMRPTLGLWFIAAVLIPTTARAECPLIDPTMSLKNAVFAFSGTVVNVDTQTRSLYWIVTLTPDEVWKGDPPRQVTASQINISEAIRFERGRKYLIFAYPYFEPSESQLRDAGMSSDFMPPKGLMSVSPCDSGPLDSDRIKGTLRFFGPGRIPPNR